MKKILIGFWVLALLVGNFNLSYAQEVIEEVAEDTTEEVGENIYVNLTIRNGESVIFSDLIPLPEEGSIDLEDTEGDNHDINARSVLSLIHSADELSNDFEISNLTYFSSFGSLYLKCITDNRGEYCDDWQYVVDGSYPYSSMDQNILSGEEDIYVYFGPQNRVTLSDGSITTSDTLTVNTEAYDYDNNEWESRDGVTVGLTQNNPDDVFSPMEILTSEVNEDGVATFSSIPAGSYNVGVKEDYYFPTEALTVTEAYAPPGSSGSGGNSKSKKKDDGKVLGATKVIFDTKKALDFIYSQQKEDGSFGEEIYTDWTAVTLATDENNKSKTIKLIKYIVENKNSGTMLTDFERHAMALMSLGLNPYNTNGENYIKKITDSFDGKQFGDINEDNDDIFALIVLQNAGYEIKDDMISNSINFILDRQLENGSWDESVDMTGAGISALALFIEKEEVKNALKNAEDFLKQKQKRDGGFVNVASTAWAIEGILALGDKPEDWIKEGNTPKDFLASKQDTDGGIENEDLNSKIWETAYVLKAFSGKTWNQVMQKFENKENEVVKTIENPIKQLPVVSKKAVIKIPENKTPIENLEEVALVNTAEVVNTNQNEEIANKKGLFKKILSRIAGIFN